MNDLLPNVTADLLLNLPGFRLYALCTILLGLKMYAVGFYTGAVRGRVKSTTIPEDAVTFGAQHVETEHPEVARVLRAHRNDMENIPLFIALGLIGVLAGVSPLGLRICLITFTAARVAHTLAYLRAMQPWRTVAYGVGQLGSLSLMVMIILRLVA